MKKYTLFIAVVLFTSTLVYGQTVKREVGDFEKISMGIAGDLYLKQGSRVSLEIEGDQDDIEDIITEVRNSTLEIRYKRSGWRMRYDRVTIYITAPEFSGIYLGGSGKIIGEGTIRADDLELRVSGSGKMNLSLIAEDLSTSISGSGNMTLEGKAREVDLSISGSGDLEAENLETEIYNVRISGSGKCYIWVSDEIKSSISGSGKVNYKGDPEKVISNVSGSGKIRKM